MLISFLTYFYSLIIIQMTETEFFDPTNTYEAWRDIQAETHETCEQDEAFIESIFPGSCVTKEDSKSAAEWLADPDNAYDIYMDSLCE